MNSNKMSSSENEQLNMNKYKFLKSKKKLDYKFIIYILFSIFILIFLFIIIYMIKIIKKKI
jgi:type IV secretory pathway component VirB8